jgi:hypothetical protein
MRRLELVKRSADMDYIHRAPDKGRQTFNLHGTKALIAVVTTERRLQFVLHRKQARKPDGASALAADQDASVRGGPLYGYGDVGFGKQLRSDGIRRPLGNRVKGAVYRAAHLKGNERVCAHYGKYRENLSPFARLRGFSQY